MRSVRSETYILTVNAYLASREATPRSFARGMHSFPSSVGDNLHSP